MEVQFKPIPMVFSTIYPKFSSMQKISMDGRTIFLFWSNHIEKFKWEDNPLLPQSSLEMKEEGDAIDLLTEIDILPVYSDLSDGWAYRVIGEDGSIYLNRDSWFRSDQVFTHSGSWERKISNKELPLMTFETRREAAEYLLTKIL